jgi:SHS2 domain-containing protein
MAEVKSGFREHEHTADWELEVWAPNLVALCEQAARGMYALSGICLADKPRIQRKFVIPAVDSEQMLVKFLNELLFYSEQYRLGFDDFRLRLDEDELTAEINGATIAHMDKEIKAVTYHNLKVNQTADGLEVRIVFDV